MTAREATVTVEQEAEWKVIRAARFAAYLDRCADLSDAVVEHAGDFLLFRGQQIARDSLSAEVEADVQANGIALSSMLEEALSELDWRTVARWLRGHNAGERAPREISGLEELVDGLLRPHFSSLHPSGSFPHQPLASESWPSRIRKRVRRTAPVAIGGRLYECTTEETEHPVMHKFRLVIDAASRLDAYDLRKEQG